MTDTMPSPSGITDPADNPSGLRQWRSQTQRIAASRDPEAFETDVRREFAPEVDEAPSGVSRRELLGLAAASVALAGLTSCRKPVTKILPYSRRPAGLIPGMPRYFASAFELDGFGIGTVVKSSDGRPTKIEGNTLHPASLGGSNAFMQGDLLNFYDPARPDHAHVPAHEADATAEDDGHGGAHQQPALAQFEAFWRTRQAAFATNGGAGLRLLMEPTSSPSIQGQVTALRAAYPQAKVVQWTAVPRTQVLEGATMVAGKPVETHLDPSRAKVIVALDCDFTAAGPESCRLARGWAASRRVKNPADADKMSRLYVVEPGFTSTGTVADHRFRVRADRIAEVVFSLAAELGVDADGPLGAALANSKGADYTARGKRWIPILAEDLKSAGGEVCLFVGDRQPAAVHAAVHAIHAHLGAVGKTVRYTDADPALTGVSVDDITQLAADIRGGSVDTLVMFGGNPVYTAPSELGFRELLEGDSIPHKVALSAHDDETTGLCEWRLLGAHDLASWGDLRGFDGTVTLRQPLVAPLFGGLSKLEFLGLMLSDPMLDQHPKLLATGVSDGALGYDMLRAHWTAQMGGGDFESFWAQAVHDGVVANSAFAPQTSLTVRNDGLRDAVTNASAPAAPSASNFEVLFTPCPKLHDGRFSNNPWMQELPEPLTKLTWDNAALLSMNTAKELGAENGDMVRITIGEQALEIPVWILPGHADWSTTVWLGYGRRLSEGHRAAKRSGFDAYVLRTSETLHFATGATVTAVGGSYKLASTQDHGTMAGRPIFRTASKSTFQSDPEFAPKESPLDKQARLHGETEADLNKSLWKERKYDAELSPYQWGMAIDLNTCTGCSACVVACVAENNIPMVGKRQVLTGREMHWLRLDRYFESQDENDGKLDVAEDPAAMAMPVPCMQCENAPCEVVCPVAASMHSPEGLNDMVYNRCIGTRYCSNNCPYKVRRFNWLDFHNKVPDTVKMLYNPDVTVRSRGVMEKCTYCVQRINAGKFAAKLDSRKRGVDPMATENLAKDGTITTACQQACPTEAITFGNILDETSKVAESRRSPLNYGLLSDLNNKPRTTFLGRVRNPNPALSGAGS